MTCWVFSEKGGKQMNRTQEKTIEAIRAYILRHDCFCNDPAYEIKKFEIEPLGVGDIVVVYAVSGRRNDEHTMASIFARTTRHIFIGPKGGITAIGNKSRRYKGWTNAMIHGYQS